MKKKEGLLKKIKKDYDLYLMFFLPVVMIIVFAYIPMGWLIVVFQNYSIFKGLSGSEWVGFSHFAKILADPEFYIIFRNTLLINLYRIIINFPAMIIFALLLNEVRRKLYRSFIQTVVYLPHFLSWVIVAGIFRSLLMSDGVVNQALSELGLGKTNFLLESKWFRTINIFQGAWKEMGFSAIIYIAAMCAVDPQLYEAAKIDGAGRIRQMWHITLPGIAPTVVLMFLMRLANILNSGALMEQILNMYNAAVYDVADIIGTYVYRNGLGKMQYSYNTAVGMFASVIGCVLIILGNKMSRSLTGRSIW